MKYIRTKKLKSSFLMKFKLNMKKFTISETDHNGIYMIERKVFLDDRGSLEKFYQKDIFDHLGFCVSDIYTTKSDKNVVRGMHHQSGRFGQEKLITCLSGAFFDVVIDLRENSKMYGKIYTKLLKEGDNLSLLISSGFSHGTYALTDNTVMLSVCSGAYLPEYEEGFNMKSLKLPFYETHSIVSEKDLMYPDFI